MVPKRCTPSEVSQADKTAVTGFLGQCPANPTFDVQTWESLFSWPSDVTLLIPHCSLLSPRLRTWWRFLKKPTGQEMGTTYGNAATAVREGMDGKSGPGTKVDRISLSQGAGKVDVQFSGFSARRGIQPGQVLSILQRNRHRCWWMSVT